jgi:hypothetical protein
MERVSGAYKRRQLLITLLLSLLVAIMFNIDSIHLFRTLWQHPAMAAKIGGAVGAIDQAVVQQLFSLPIGWESFPPKMDSAFLLQAAGWMVTAATTLFGAPFWFDLLQRAVQMRGTGGKPEETPKAIKAEAAVAVRAEPARG